MPITNNKTTKEKVIMDKIWIHLIFLIKEIPIKNNWRQGKNKKKCTGARSTDTK